jgi:hypothetical protein
METQDDPHWKSFENYIREISELRQLVIDIERRNNELERIAGSSSPVDVAYFPPQSGEELDSIHKRYEEYDRVTYEEVLLIIDDEKLRRSLVPQSGREKVSPGLGIMEPNNGKRRFQTRLWKTEYERYKIYEEQRKQLRQQLETVNELNPQSGIEGITISKTMPLSKHATMNFDDESMSHHYIVDSEYDNTRYLRDKNDANLDDIFKRPVRIATYPWSPSITLAATFNPWSLFLDNPRVANRLSNYKLMRGKLRVKAVINGNGFYYGRLLLAYNPLPGWDDLSTHSALIRTDLVQTTQLPHIYIDPTTSQGGEMTLPFFWYEDYVDISTADWTELGEMYVRVLNPLKHANGANTPLNVTIFAWMEDIEFSVPTATNQSTLTPQSGEEIEEANSKGIISGPASVISKMAKVASGISVIAPYAMATSKAADMIGGMAKLFGYCAPPITKAPEPYRPQPTSTLALTNVPQTTNRLTLDEKQELSIDPRIAGLSGDDPLNIRDIAKREAYYTSFTYSLSQSTDNIIFQMAVNPAVWRNFAGANPGTTGFMFPPCAVAAMPFQFWTGTMRYRFQIVSSAFHKGRLRIGYDPSATPSDPEYNINYQRIVDISKDRDVTIEIGPAQTTALMRPYQWSLGDRESSMFTTSSTPLTFNPGNGFIFVSVLNELTVPNSDIDNDIEINVFVSAGDDFEVFVPTSSELVRMTFFDQEPLPPQSGIEHSPNDIAAENDNAPFSTNMERMGTNEQVLTDLNKVFAGEAIASFRPLLKRAMLHESLEIQSGQRVASWIRNYFPKLQGFSPDAQGANDFNYVPTNLLHWVRYAFQGHRGSIRWKAVPNIPRTGNMNLYAHRLWPTGTQEATAFALPSYGNQDVNGFENIYSALSLETPDGGIASWDGAAYTDSPVNTTLEVEIPYYSRFRFSPGKDARQSSFTPFDPSFRWRATYFSNSDGALDTWCSTGEDFQVYFWTGLPRMYLGALPDP